GRIGRDALLVVEKSGNRFLDEADGRLPRSAAIRRLVDQQCIASQRPRSLVHVDRQTDVEEVAGGAKGHPRVGGALKATSGAQRNTWTPHRCPDDPAVEAHASDQSAGATV